MTGRLSRRVSRAIRIGAQTYPQRDKREQFRNSAVN